MVLGLTAAAQCLAARAMEVERGGVEEHHREIAEHIALTLEQSLLDPILGPPQGARGVASIGELLPQPGHRPVEMMQVHILRPVDAIGLHPVLAGAVRARDYEPVQHQQ